MTQAPFTKSSWFVLEEQHARAYTAACGGAWCQNTVPPMAAAIGTLVQGVRPIVAVTLGQDTQGEPIRIMHREESLRWHGPLRLNTPYRVDAALQKLEQRRAATFMRIAVQLVHPELGPVVSSESALFLPTSSSMLQGAAKTAVAPEPQHGAKTVRLSSWRIAADQPERYAHASLETNPIHLDDAYARAVGLPGRVLHGMCTLAYAARVATEEGPRAIWGAPPDTLPLRLKSIACRFVQPVFPGDTLTCRVTACSQKEQLTKLTFDVVQQQGIVVLNRGTMAFESLQPK